MTVQVQPLNVINAKAIHILSKEIGLDNTLRFINQFTPGYGNYTEEHEKLFNKMSVTGIVKEIKRMKSK